MLNLKYHTPEGVMDYCRTSARQKRSIEQKMGAIVSPKRLPPNTDAGVRVLRPLRGRQRRHLAGKALQVFDPQGRILALRGDITTSIARVMGTKYNGPMPARLC